MFSLLATYPTSARKLTAVTIVSAPMRLPLLTRISPPWWTCPTSNGSSQDSALPQRFLSGLQVVTHIGYPASASVSSLHQFQHSYPIPRHQIRFPGGGSPDGNPGAEIKIKSQGKEPPLDPLRVRFTPLNSNVYNDERRAKVSRGITASERDEIPLFSLRWRILSVKIQTKQSITVLDE